MHATLADVTGLSKMQTLQQKGAASTGRSAQAERQRRAYRLVQPRCFSWTGAPEISNACLIFSGSMGFPGTPQCRSTFGWEGACAGTPQVCAASGSPIAALGTLPPRGQALAALGTPLAAEGKESLEAEEMPSVSRLNSSSCREGHSHAAARRAGPGTAEPWVPGFLPIAQGDTDFSPWWQPSPRNRAAAPQVLEAV